ncbi:MAG: DUF4294 domain-containing protein [Muribaculaceae bacterium]|nr:DUF4294 domain-containing protein [Muribaculaceae bacterium]
MKHWLVVIFLAFVAVQVAAQNEALTIDESQLSPIRSVYHGMYHDIDPLTGDTTMWIVMNPIIVYPNERFRNKKDEEFYWKTVRDVKKTLPYAKLINRTLQETYEYLQTFETKKEKDAYLKKFEKQLYAQYKPIMKKFTKNQGKIMIKLVNRETNQNSYNIVKAFMGTFRAGFWQTFGRFFGVNLKAEYRPQKDKNDALIERICVRVEQGLL